MAYLPFILRQALRHWQVLFPLILGLILATGLLASGPMLVDTIMDFAMIYKLRSAEALKRDLRLTAYENPNSLEYQSLDSQVRTRIANNLGGYTDAIISTASSHWAHPWVDNQLLRDHRINLRFYQDIENHVEFVSGNFPSDAIYQNGMVKGVISESLAEDYDLETGDRLPLSYQANEVAKTVFELQDGKLISSLSGDGRSLSEKVPIPPSESITAMWCEFRADDTQPTEV
jgi:hypothetical protein